MTCSSLLIANRGEIALRIEAAKAVNSAVGGGIDDVIDPAETWIVAGLRAMPPIPLRT